MLNSQQGVIFKVFTFCRSRTHNQSRRISLQLRSVKPEADTAVHVPACFCFEVEQVSCAVLATCPPEGARGPNTQDQTLLSGAVGSERLCRV